MSTLLKCASKKQVTCDHCKETFNIEDGFVLSFSHIKMYLCSIDCLQIFTASLKALSKKK
jgi:hypothetical protein